MEYFDKVAGGCTWHTSGTDGAYSSVRFLVARHGEDVGKVVEAFYKEHGHGPGFLVVPVFGHGKPPRPELSTPESLKAAGLEHSQ